MNKKLLLKNIISWFLCITLIFTCSLFCFAESFFETQFEYEKSDIAWLSDVTIKLNLDTVSGVINSLTLKPITDYPYSETSESFKKDVDNFANINLLNEGAPRAAYIYFFELLASSEGLVAGEMSDSDIQSFFKAQGIDFNLDDDNDSLIVARAVYTAMVTGVLSDYTTGASLEDLAVDFVCSLSGLDEYTLAQWLPEEENASLDDYLLAVSKSTLWTAGYDVDSSTDDSTVYKLMACMVIENNGLTADISSNFDTLKLKFLSAMLSKKYEISADWEAVGAALDEDTLALYVLKTIGMRDGVSVGERSFEDAFTFICETTDEFVLENQFYADIYNYNIEIDNDISKLWINATPVCSNGTVIISANDNILNNSYYNAIDFDTTVSDPVLTINVSSVQGESSSSCTYKFNFIKLSEEATATDFSEQVSQAEEISEAVSKIYLSSETLLSGLLANINMDTSSNTALAKSISAFDEKSQSAMAVIAPTFEENKEADDEVRTDEECIVFLDKIGGMIDTNISGINGIEVLSEISSDAEYSDYISFDF